MTENGKNVSMSSLDYKGSNISKHLLNKHYNLSDMSRVQSCDLQKTKSGPEYDKNGKAQNRNNPTLW